MLLSSLATDSSKLLCQMGAGKGKSRVAAALAFYFLSVSKKQVYIVFTDEGLKNRDENYVRICGSSQRQLIRKLDNAFIMCLVLIKSPRIKEVLSLLTRVIPSCLLIPSTSISKQITGI